MHFKCGSGRWNGIHRIYQTKCDSEFVNNKRWKRVNDNQITGTRTFRAASAYTITSLCASPVVSWESSREGRVKCYFKYLVMRANSNCTQETVVLLWFVPCWIRVVIPQVPKAASQTEWKTSFKKLLLSFYLYIFIV